MIRDSAIAVLAATVLTGLCACQSSQQQSTAESPPAAATPASPAPSAPPAPPPATDDKVTLAVSIAKEIADDPDHAADVLSQHGMTEKQFEALMFDIAADPDLSRRYSAAMER